MALRSTLASQPAGEQPHSELLQLPEGVLCELWPAERFFWAFGVGSRALSMTLLSGVRVISLAHQAIGDGGVHALVAALQEMPQVVSADLSHNNFQGDPAARAIASWLGSAGPPQQHTGSNPGSAPTPGVCRRHLFSSATPLSPSSSVGQIWLAIL